MGAVVAGIGLQSDSSGFRIHPSHISLPPGKTSPGSGSVPKSSEMHLSGVPDVRNVGGTWWVAQTKLQQEKNLAADLEAEDVAYYLPLVKRNSHKRGKRETVEVPLFTSYLFFAGDQYVRYAAVMTHRTIAVIPVVDQPKFVRQLRAVQVAVDDNPMLGVWNRTPKGTRVDVVRGALKGAEGVVEDVFTTKARVRLILRLDMLGQSLAVEIPPEFVNPK